MQSASATVLWSDGQGMLVKNSVVNLQASLADVYLANAPKDLAGPGFDLISAADTLQ